jgi:hypothetical protein
MVNGEWVGTLVVAVANGKGWDEDEGGSKAATDTGFYERAKLRQNYEYSESKRFRAKYHWVRVKV